MTTIKKIKMVIAALLITSGAYPQNQLPTLAVISIDSKGIEHDSESLAYMVRLEIEKIKQYNVMDKYDMAEAIKKTNIDVKGCFGKNCVVAAGKQLGVDKIITGGVEQFAGKIVISIKLIDVNTSTVEKSDATEFLNVPDEMQRMIRISLQKLFGLLPDENTVEMLVNYDLPVSSPKSELRLNGPRMGASFFTGDARSILTSPEGVGGFNMYPATFMFGWQKEWQYLSAGNFQALIEFIPMIGGLESGHIIPYVTVMNGFRLNKSGWEIAFGPSFRWVNKADGFYYNNQWYLEENREHLAVNDSSLLDQNLYPTYNRLDSRGPLTFSTSLVIGVGKTIKSGYLNIPVNVYYSPRKEGPVYGFSFGFNIYGKRHRS
ncbi:MAG: hypothetical protein ABI723_21305 [Bacteroidia bacterium]